MDGKHAVGVEISRFGKTEIYRANAEIILSAGTVGLLHILMLSEIGDEQHLTDMRIETVHHIPNIGKNLLDHLMVGLNMDVKEGLGTDPL